MNVYYEVRGSVAMLQIDNPPVNGLSHPVREALAHGIERALGDAAVEAIALTGTGRVYSGGADIREFNTPAMLAPPSLLDLIAQVERASKPVVAAINGVCMGGGLELALACHYRVATPGARLALPEVKIGLVPGAGGTQRLPRAVGAAKALEMIAGGDAVDARDALASGLVERIVPDDSFDGVLVFAQEVAARRPLPRLRDRGVVLPPGADAQAFFAQAQAQVARRARGLTAPRKCVEAVQAACTLPFDEGMNAERAIFAERLQSNESKALRHAFFAERAAAKLPDLPEGTAAPTVARIGIAGFDGAGVELALLLAKAGLPLRAFDPSAAALERGLARCHGHWQAQVEAGRLDPARAAQRRALLAPARTLAEFADCDLALVDGEAPDAGSPALWRELDRALPAGAPIALVTPSAQAIAAAAAHCRPARVLGLQPGAPRPGARLLEWLRGPRSEAAALAAPITAARRAGLATVVARGASIGRRCLAAYVDQALRLVQAGAAPAQIDAALLRFGMAAGPLALADLIGLDAVARLRGPGPAEDRIDARLIDAGRLGQRSGAGWYRYGEGDAQPDPAVDALIEAWRRDASRAPRAIDDAEIADRCLLALVNEGARLLQQGVAARAGDIDLVLLAGYGFPPAAGGPMFWARARGLDKVAARMREFAAQDADPASDWQPAPLLEAAAAQGRWPQ